MLQDACPAITDLLADHMLDQHMLDQHMLDQHMLDQLREGRIT